MMRIVLVIVAALTLGPSPAEAQRMARRYFGVTAGASYSSLTNYNVATDWRWGASAGVMVGTLTFDFSFVEFAPAWTQLGGSGLRLDYVDLPLMLGGLIPVAQERVLLRLYGGVSLGLKVGCSTEVAAACDAVKGSSWGLPIGGSIATTLGTGRFVGLDGRYLLGLSDAFEVLDVTNRSWQFRAFFGFPIGGF